jgi:hypothetical protein
MATAYRLRITTVVPPGLDSPRFCIILQGVRSLPLTPRPYRPQPSLFIAAGLLTETCEHPSHPQFHLYESLALEPADTDMT